jgi:CelD/BcsL family acetyltransferase involved in cellulose biosynthesis
MKEQITPEVVARIAYIQENSWVKSQGGAILVQSFYQKLLAEMGKAGIGCVWLMTKGKDDIAFIYAFRIKDSQYLKWMAYRLEHGYSPTLSFGKVLYMQMVRDACKEGIRLLDLGFGQDSWKRLWATDSHNIERIIAGPSFIGHMTIFCYAILRFCARCKFLLGCRLRKLMNIRK